jgi:hypothetical protein
MLGRHSPTELLPQPQILLLLLFFTLAVLGLELRTLGLQSGTLLLEPYNHFQPEWPGPESTAFLMREICIGDLSLLLLL